jgi:hypothetical protein
VLAGTLDMCGRTMHERSSLIWAITIPKIREKKEKKTFSNDPVQGCQMAYFKTKNTNLGKFLRVLQRKMLVYFMATWPTYLLYRTFGTFLAIWYLLWLFVMYFPVLVFCIKKNLATLIQSCRLFGLSSFGFSPSFVVK